MRYLEKPWGYNKIYVLFKLITSSLLTVTNIFVKVRRETLRHKSGTEPFRVGIENTQRYFK